jgi:hypothetical protein
VLIVVFEDIVGNAAWRLIIVSQALTETVLGNPKIHHWVIILSGVGERVVGDGEGEGGVVGEGGDWAGDGLDEVDLVVLA